MYGQAGLADFVPLLRIISMDKLDWKIRRFLVDEGYLFPTTDAEIERALKECEENPVTIIPELDNHLI